jgi:hypothetical protein
MRAAGRRERRNALAAAGADEDNLVLAAERYEQQICGGRVLTGAVCGSWLPDQQRAGDAKDYTHVVPVLWTQRRRREFDSDLFLIDLLGSAQ